MTLRALAEQLGLQVFVGADALDREVSGGYASDLLSDVVANSVAGDLWVTLQVHENTVAVARLRELSGIILVGGRAPEEETIRLAREHQIPILGTDKRTFEIVSELLNAGVSPAGAA